MAVRRTQQLVSFRCNRSEAKRRAPPVIQPQRPLSSSSASHVLRTRTKEQHDWARDPQAATRHGSQNTHAPRTRLATGRVDTTWCRPLASDGHMGPWGVPSVLTLEWTVEGVRAEWPLLTPSLTRGVAVADTISKSTIFRRTIYRLVRALNVCGALIRIFSIGGAKVQRVRERKICSSARYSKIQRTRRRKTTFYTSMHSTRLNSHIKIMKQMIYHS
jgi:hypothetical protein